MIFVFLGAALVKLDQIGWLEWAKRRSKRANRWSREEKMKEKEKGD